MRFDLNTLSMFTVKNVSRQQLLHDVERNVPQTALPRTASESFVRKVNAEQKQHAALHALRSAITFLSLCGAARYDPTMPLKKYMSKYLFVEAEECEIFSDNIQLQHCVCVMDLVDQCWDVQLSSRIDRHFQTDIPEKCKADILKAALNVERVDLLAMSNNLRP